MQILKNLIVPGSKGKPILLDVFFKKAEKPRPVIIFVHGFKGFKDWGHFNLMAEKFAEAGFVFVKFNFSHNGTTPDNPFEFTDLEAFGNNNYILELEDLGKVIDWTISGECIPEQIIPDQIYLIGHSRGGGISILKAGEDKRITKVVAWASVCDFLNRNKQRTIEEWKEMGVIFTVNGRTKQQMPLYYQFHETIQANAGRLNILKAARELKTPFLIVHGTQDEAVPEQEALQLHKACSHSELVIINEANHTFGGKHPYNSSELPLHSSAVISKTIQFLEA